MVYSVWHVVLNMFHSRGEYDTSQTSDMTDRLSPGRSQVGGLKKKRHHTGIEKLIIDQQRFFETEMKDYVFVSLSLSNREKWLASWGNNIQWRIWLELAVFAEAHKGKYEHHSLAVKIKKKNCVGTSFYTENKRKKGNLEHFTLANSTAVRYMG